MKNHYQQSTRGQAFDTALSLSRYLEVSYAFVAMEETLRIDCTQESVVDI